MSRSPKMDVGNDSKGINSLQFKDQRTESKVRGKIHQFAKEHADTMVSGLPIQKVANNTGLPDQLKSGIESLSGYSMNDVKVHYNSSRPAQFQALAYAQGNQIHLGPGQERHLPHEAWHVVQQKQGRVKPTRQLKGITNVNDDPVLEKEADVMGSRALQGKGMVKVMVSRPTARSLIQKKLDHKRSVLQRVNTSVNNTMHSGNVNTPFETIRNHFHLGATGLVYNGIIGNGAPGALGLSFGQESRPSRREVLLDTHTGGGAHPPLVTAIGRFGTLEGNLNAAAQPHDGGHLVALELWNTAGWINQSTNLAAQDRNENQHGAWRNQEMAIAGLLQTPPAHRDWTQIRYRVRVNYVRNNYSVPEQAVWDRTFGVYNAGIVPRPATNNAINFHGWSANYYHAAWMVKDHSLLDGAAKGAALGGTGGAGFGGFVGAGLGLVGGGIVGAATNYARNKLGYKKEEKLFDTGV